MDAARQLRTEGVAETSGSDWPRRHPPRSSPAALSQQERRRAPPVLRTAVKMPGHASAAEQMAAIAAMRERSTGIEAGAAALKREAAAQKRATMQRHHAARWVQERAALAVERRDAAAELQAAMTHLAPLSPQASAAGGDDERLGVGCSDGADATAADAHISLECSLAAREYAAQCADTADDAGATLGGVRALRSRLVALISPGSDARAWQPSAELLEFQRAIDAAKACIGEEQGLLEQQWGRCAREEAAAAAARDASDTRSNCSSGISNSAAVAARMDMILNSAFSVPQRHLDCDSQSFSGTSAAATFGEGAAHRGIRQLEAQVDAEQQSLHIRFPAASDELRGLFSGAIAEQLCRCRDAVDAVFGDCSDALEKMEQAGVPPNVVTRCVMLSREYSSRRRLRGGLDVVTGSAVRGAEGRRAELLDRLRSEFPTVSEQQARDCCEWAFARSRNQQRAAALVRDAVEGVKALLRHMTDAARAEQDAADAADAERAAQRERDRDRDERVARLAELRAGHDAAAAAAAETALEAEEARLRDIAAREARREAELAARLKQLAAHRAAQEAARDAERRAREQAALVQRLEAEERAAHNAARVHFREVERQARLDAARLRKLLLEDERDEKQAQLRRFSERMEAALGVSRDKQRAMAPTAASEAPDVAPCLREAAARVQEVHGYSDDHIHRDPRFRLQVALVAAGLHTTAYGRAVLREPSGGTKALANVPSAENPFAC